MASWGIDFTSRLAPVVHSISGCVTIGGTGFDAGYSFSQTSDGNFIVAGATDSFGSGGCDAWVVKVDGAGNDTAATTTDINANILASSAAGNTQAP